jgi:hypothetical protein
MGDALLQRHAPLYSRPDLRRDDERNDHCARLKFGAVMSKQTANKQLSVAEADINRLEHEREA